MTRQSLKIPHRRTFKWRISTNLFISVRLRQTAARLIEAITIIQTHSEEKESWDKYKYEGVSKSFRTGRL
jgi:hypothetical protein